MAEPEQPLRETTALAYLTGQLGRKGPSKLTFVATISETPLYGEGAVSLFSFWLTPDRLPAQNGGGGGDNPPPPWNGCMNSSKD